MQNSRRAVGYVPMGFSSWGSHYGRPSHYLFCSPARALGTMVFICIYSVFEGIVF